MSLASGTRVGPYEVVGPIGAGGMGEVYRAHDPRLGRHVALKVLPDTLSGDEQRRGRFIREAQVLASLNHPNISTLLGVEDLNGHQVLVMELVEGETLGDRLARLGSPMSIRQVLPIARQIVDALDAAHERGIVHRDLKPDNVAVRPDGTVKVLDFGVAKVLEAADGGIGLPASTITEVVEGVAATIAGTPAYMSPEQMRAEPVSASADIWAFGCVLYEMLTGRPAFGAHTRRELFMRVLEGEADFTLLPANTPPLVERLVRRCLDKDRKQRLRHIADARAYLEDAVTTSSDVQVVIPARSRRFAGWIAMTAVAGGLVAALITWLALRETPPAVMRTVILTERPAVLEDTPDKNLALTHDGSRLVYVGSNGTQIYVRSLDALTPTMLVTTTPGFELRGLSISPDDQWVSYVENSYTLKKVALTGGAPITILNLNAPFRGATWESASSIIFSTNARDTGIRRISADGGAVTMLTRPDLEQEEAAHTWPELLPDGRAVLFTIVPASGGFDGAQVAVLDLASGTTKKLVTGGRNAQYAPSGHLVFAARSELRAISFDLRRLEVRGTPVTVVPNVATDGLGSADFTMSAAGTLAYLERIPTRSKATWVDRNGNEEPLEGSSGGIAHPRISPVNDARIALSSFVDLFFWELPRPPVQLTFTPSLDWLPLWMPDGERLVFGSARAGTGVSNLYMQRADGTDAVERLTDSPHMQLPYSITPDGTAVLFTVFGPATGPDVQLIRLTGASSPRTEEPVLDTPRHERNATVSPDGRWLAYESDTAAATASMNVYVRRFPLNPDGGVWQVSTDGGTHPLWSRKGDELFYLASDGAMMAARVDTRGDRWIPGTPARLFKGPYVIHTSETGRHFDVTSDGRRFLMIREEPLTHRAIILVQHWAEELKRQVR